MVDLGTPSLPAQPSPPEFALSDLLPHAIRGGEVVALPVLPPVEEGGAPLLGPGAAELAEHLSVDLLALLTVVGACGKAGEVTTLPLPSGGPDDPGLGSVLLVGLGEQRPADLRRAGAALARAVRDRSTLVTSIAATGDAETLEAFVVATMLATFSLHCGSGEPRQRPVRRVVLAGVPATEQAALERAIAVGGAAWRSRQLATVPSNVKNPAWLAEEAREVAEAAGLKYSVWDEEQLAAQGFGGIVAVGQASATPPRLIRLDHTPPRAGRRTPTVVLVGKGITFDSGGLSIKPAESMATMKRDMTGGAVVIATMAALRAVGCPVRVIGLVPAAENAVSGNALRPGDVIRHYGGRTSEVTNTDAEGRLVMADALAYAVAELDPAVVVDVATLTGAMKVALGQTTGGIFANDDALAGALLEAGEAAGEPLWRMPLWAGYEEKLASTVADADNGASGAGAILAALFLQHFVGSTTWAHLDVASVGDAPADRDEWTAGPTGFGVRALLRWLGSEDPLAGVGAP